MAFSTHDPDAIYGALTEWDQDPNWSPNASVEIIILGGSALAFYHASQQRETADIDAWIVRSSVLPDRLVHAAESIGLSFRAGNIAWIPQDWDEHVQWSSRSFQHIIVGWFDPYDWVITKLGRWMGHDMDDAISVAQHLDPVILHDRVRSALPEYIGYEPNVHMAWADLADALGWPSDLRSL